MTMMRALIAEDDFASRKFMERLLSPFGDCDLVVDGLETIDAYLMAIKEKKPYDLIALDIMLPKIDGVKVLKAIREMEAQRGILPEKRVKVVLTTALGEGGLVQTAFEIGCQAYVSKPIDIDKFLEILCNLKLIS
jgi:two-component system chemotaxis response regulator CheY